MVLKQLGMASVSIQAGVEGFLELEPNSNTRFLSGRTVTATYFCNYCTIFSIFSPLLIFCSILLRLDIFLNELFSFNLGSW